MTTLIIGASSNPQRYANHALKYLRKQDIKVYAIGLRPDIVDDVAIQTGFPELGNIHTVLLYIGPDKQKEYYNYIISLQPKRLIFNPGTVNSGLINLAEKKGIKVVVNCALTMMYDLTY